MSRSLTHSWTPHLLHDPAIDMTRCRASVWQPHGSHQCFNKGHEEAEDKLWCKIHNPERVRATNVAKAEKWKQESEERQARWAYGRDMDEWESKCALAIRSIAAGHNAPRALAQELLALEPRKVVPTSES